MENVKRAEPRFNPSDVIKSDLHREILWSHGFLKLMHVVECLEAEGTIEPATAEILTQCAYDFQVALRALDEGMPVDKND